MEASTQTVEPELAQSTGESNEGSISADVRESLLMQVFTEPVRYAQELRLIAVDPSNVEHMQAVQELQEYLIRTLNSKDVEVKVDAEEANKLFTVLVENDLSFREFLGSPRARILAPPDRAYRPYPVHQQLYLRQQQEQERRRQNLLRMQSSRQVLTVGEFGRMLNPSRYYGVEFRKQIVQAVIAYIGKHSTLPVATQNDCCDQCIICITNYQVNQMLRKLRCGHRYHRKCIDEWLVKKYVCPTCRCRLCEDLLPDSRVAVEYFMVDEDTSIPTAAEPQQSVNDQNSPSSCGSSSSNQHE